MISSPSITLPSKQGKIMNKYSPPLAASSCTDQSHYRNKTCYLQREGARCSKLILGRRRRDTALSGPSSPDALVGLMMIKSILSDHPATKANWVAGVTLTSSLPFECINKSTPFVIFPPVARKSCIKAAPIRMTTPQVDPILHLHLRNFQSLVLLLFHVTSTHSFHNILFNLLASTKPS